ncbi:MAG TPA: hypothetical protein VGE39_08115 [Prosthecobacter sp.]
MSLDKVLFDPGAVVATPSAISVLREAGVEAASILDRHVSGDFGDVGKIEVGSSGAASSEYLEVFDSNCSAVLSRGENILSVYRLPDNKVVCVKTLADRSNTVVFLPEED